MFAKVHKITTLLREITLVEIIQLTINNNNSTNINNLHGETLETGAKPW